MDVVEEIKRRINIVDLAADLGLNPTKSSFIYSIFKDEKNRSLKLYPNTNSFYCYSSGKGGDVINFYSVVKKIDNRDTIRILSAELGLNGFSGLQDFPRNGRAGKIETHSITGLQDSNKKNIKIYHSLEKFCNGVDKAAYQYLTGKKRGLSERTIKKFRLFSIKDLKGTIDFLINKYQLNELKLSGLFNENGRFVFTRHRLIISYLDGDTIDYLRGRLFPDYENDDTGKYIGLAGRPAKRLFNLNALKNLKDGSDVLLSEGEFDAMRADQERLKVVGVPGVNNFPEEGKELLNRFDIYICFDKDAAGLDGMQRVTNILNKNTTGLFLQKHKDITEFFNESGKKDLTDRELVDIRIIHPAYVEPEAGRAVSNNKYHPITANQLQKMEIPPINWIVEGLLPEGLTMLAGKPKSGKSWMALCMAIDVAKETKVLNKFNSIKSTVLYIALEDSRRRMQDRTNNITGADYEKSLPDNLLIFTIDDDFPKLNESGLDVINSLLEVHSDLKFIIIDTFGRAIRDVHGRNKNIYLADYDLMSSIQRFALDKRIGILLIHHTKKGKEDHAFDEISGTTGITGALDTMMVIKKDRGKTFLHVTGRDVIDAEHPITFDVNSFRWKIVEEKAEANVTAERQEIIEMFRKYKRRMRTGEVAELLEKKKNNVSNMLKKLVDDNIIYSPSYGVYDLVKEKKEAEGNLFNEIDE